MLNKLFCFLTLFCCLFISTSSYADADGISVYQSVQKALEYSPHLLALSYNHTAAESDLKQAFDRYFPSVDLMLGYGFEQYSDRVTRHAGADPDNTDVDSRTDASLKLTQMIYDGGEIRQNVSIQEALLATASHRIENAKQSISLDAIMAHLEVYRQRELVVLAEQNFAFHQDIYKSLSEMEQAGAGNIADVTQTQSRLARAESNLFIIKADLSRAVTNYIRITGMKPGELSFAGIPPIMPDSLDNALEQMEQKNPELLIFDAKRMEADARLGLAYAIDRPKINLELGTRYIDQYQGESSWQNTNDAMLVLRWNLFNGGQDKQMKMAALSRKQERQANWNDKLIELRQATSAAWVTYLSLQEQKTAFAEAKKYSQKTFEVYLKQFGVSKRDLLDVLSAKNEYFLSAQQLITTDVNLSISANRILMLTAGIPVVE